METEGIRSDGRAMSVCFPGSMEGSAESSSTVVLMFDACWRGADIMVDKRDKVLLMLLLLLPIHHWMFGRRGIL